MIFFHATDFVPLWILFIGMISITLLVVELGFHLGRWYASEHDLSKYPMEQSANATVIGLLTFLLAFSFNSSARHYGDVRTLLFKDKNLIHQVHQAARILPDAEAAQIVGLIDEYAQIRVDLMGKSDPNAFKAVADRSEEIQTELFDIAVEIQKDNTNPMVRIYLQSVQSLTSNHHELINLVFAKRLPRVAWFTLVGLGSASGLLFGFSCGLLGRRRYVPAVIIITAFSSVVLLIIDLDRPIHSLATDTRDALTRSIEN